MHAPRIAAWCVQARALRLWRGYRVMDLIGGIGAATEGLKLINELRKIDKEVDKAELKLRLVEVADKLLDSKQALQDAQEREFGLQKVIADLEAKLSDRGRFRDMNGFLFQIDENGKDVGEPFCNHCYVKEEKLYRLIDFPTMSGSHKCNNCGEFLGARQRSSAELVPRRSIFD